ncbi:MAG: hypothetical protein ACK44Q_10300, partial [Pirellulaceae bacterium]
QPSEAAPRSSPATQPRDIDSEHLMSADLKLKGPWIWSIRQICGAYPSADRSGRDEVVGGKGNGYKACDRDPTLLLGFKACDGSHPS